MLFMWNLKQYWGDFTCPGVKTPLSMTLFIPRLDMAWRCPLHIQRTLQVYRDPWTWSSQCYRHCNKSFTGIECWGQIMCKSFPSTPKLSLICAKWGVFSVLWHQNALNLRESCCIQQVYLCKAWNYNASNLKVKLAGWSPHWQQT